MSNRKLLGRIKWYNPAKGYGFILNDGDEDIFFHASGVLEQEPFNFQPLDQVTYYLGASTNGVKAVQIQKYVKP